MCPKAKSDRVVTHRIEFQQTERDALEMVAASIAARNVTASVSNLITPLLGASVAGVALALSVAGAVGIAKEADKAGVQAEDVPPFFFGLIPGASVAVWRHVNWNTIQNEFDKRMRNYNPPEIR